MRPLSSRFALKNRGNSRYSRKFLAAKAVQGPALPLQSVHDVYGCDSLPLCMLSLGHGVADDILKKHLRIDRAQKRRCARAVHLQDPPSLFIDEAADSLNSSSSCQSSDGWFGDSLNI